MLKFIQENRPSTSDMVDAGSDYLKVSSLTKGLYCYGEMQYVIAIRQSNYSVHKGLQKITRGSIVFIDNFSCGDLALCGEIIICYAMDHGAKAIVVNGNIRDVEKLEGMPVWYKGTNPKACNKLPVEHKIPDLSGIVVCDDTGVSYTDKDITKELTKILKREKDWKRQLEKGKSTFEIACKPSN